MLRRTKIVCTMGPATDKPGVMEKLIEVGVNVFRVNTSHNGPEEHAGRVHRVRQLAESAGGSIAILVDLPGPKFRLGNLAEGPRELHAGDIVRLGGSADGNLPVRVPSILKQVHHAQQVHLADGMVSLTALDYTPNGGLRCRVVAGGRVRSGAGMNLPETDLAVQVPTPTDTGWIKFALKHEAEWLGLSFVRTHHDILRVRRMIAGYKRRPLIMAKIEKRQAVINLDQIIAVVDGVMVARGDLGVETPLAEIPMLQKKIIAAANAACKPVITATQMLESMIDQRSPTRAEVTDAANAIIDGTDAFMLSGETAIGKFPVEAVSVLGRVATATESQYPFYRGLSRNAAEASASTLDAIARAASRLAYDSGAKAIIVAEEPFPLAFKVSSFRSRVPVIAICDDAHQARQMALSWGVHPLIPTKKQTVLSAAHDWLSRNHAAKRGDLIVILSPGRLEGHAAASVQVASL